MRCTPTIHELIVLTLPPRHRCPLDRLPASRLLLPRSGLERSDFVPWHETDHRCRSGDVRCSGKTGSGVSGPSGQLLCRFSDAGYPRAAAAGVRKAPMHEVAGSWALAGSECYGDLMLAPISMMSGTPARHQLDVWRREVRRSDIHVLDLRAAGTKPTG
jgi:hypothetical protein